jgi:lipoprotein-anchoring transpeptidase ErfK/SrfK
MEAPRNRLAMRSHPFVCVLLAAGALLASGASAIADPQIDANGRFDDGSVGPATSGGLSSIPRATVNYSGDYKPGTIVISTAERRLYYVVGDGLAIRYGIAVGRDGFTWSGVERVSAKRAWPDWTPPPDMRRRQPDLPRHMKGGLDNPLGARALYLGSTVYRIHGSNEPETVGQAASWGCFRLTNEDVIDLFDRVKLGTVVIIRQ